MRLPGFMADAVQRQAVRHRIVLCLRIFRLGIQALWAYRTRSLFVVLAVSLGIASLTLIVAAIDGAQKKALEIVNFFGHDTILVFGGNIKSRAVGQRYMTITPRDLRWVRDTLPGVYLAVPMSSKGGVSLRNGSRNYQCPITVGSGAGYATVWNWPLSEGRDISDEDVLQSAKVCLIGDIPARQLFGDESPIGKTIQADNLTLQVIGLLSYRGFSGGHTPVDERIIVPITTLIQRFNLDRRHYRAMRVKLLEPELMDTHKENLRTLLRKLHNLKEDDDDDFSIIAADEVLKFFAMLKGGLIVFLGITSAGAIIVGGFVLANLFYLSVSERREEIGVKMALGARSSYVLMQFLFEALALTFVGALLGMILGILAGEGLERLEIMEIRLSWKIFFLSVASGAAVAVIFGLKPARHAASLNPIRALRGDE